MENRAVRLPRIDDDILLALAIFLVLLALASFISVFVYGRFAKRARGEDSWSLPVAGGMTPADRIIAPLTEARPDATGVMVLSVSRDAFAARALTARSAGRSLDMMYYLWRGDLTGSLLIEEALAAADRGVRVRLLLDDINTRGLDPEYLALSGHPNIEVRLFNPAKNRAQSLRRGAEMLLRLFTVTRRMHNKAWIVDGRVAIIGGRNIGDTYFDAARDINSADMDAALIGPAVSHVSAIFDEFWNSALVLPISSLWKDRVADLVTFRSTLAAVAQTGPAREYLAGSLPGEDAAALFDAGPPIFWSKTARVLSDPPAKTQRLEKERWLINTLAATLSRAEKQVRITTAYFVPGREGVDGLRRISERGVRISILTNSLASTNQVTVHGGYAESRPALLKCGIRLFELRPCDADRAESSLFGSDGATLHAKNFSIDGRISFIGSFNFDLRSAFLNTEMGLLVEDAEIATQIDAVFVDATSERKSYEVVLGENGLQWHEGNGPVLDSEPETGRARRLVAEIVRYLPVKGQL